jgi:uncharacterized protein YbcV (DUF1398 family)
MNQETINTIERFQKATTYCFPEKVKTLAEKGVDWYYADLIQHQQTYYGRDESTYTTALPLVTTPKSSTDFSETKVIEALRAIERGDITYPEFLTRIAQAGTVSYTIFLRGKKVLYVGAKGETYTEPFPGE